MLHVKICALAGCSFKKLLHEILVVGMSSLKNQVQRWLRRTVVSKNLKRLLRPEYLASGNLPPEAAGATQTLGLGQIGFAAAKLCFGPLPILDINGGSI